MAELVKDYISRNVPHRVMDYPEGKVHHFYLEGGKVWEAIL